MPAAVSRKIPPESPWCTPCRLRFQGGFGGLVGFRGVYTLEHPTDGGEGLVQSCGLQIHGFRPLGVFGLGKTKSWADQSAEIL